MVWSEAKISFANDNYDNWIQIICALRQRNAIFSETQLSSSLKVLITSDRFGADIASTTGGLPLLLHLQSVSVWFIKYTFAAHIEVGIDPYMEINVTFQQIDKTDLD